MSLYKNELLVTGSNKGIGLAIVRALCKQFDGDVYLTARDVNRGENAVKKLNQEGLSPKFHQLDIVDDSSVELLRDFLKDVYGGLDVLVNNAGITFKEDAPFSDKAEVILRTNFWGTLKICDNFFPILKPHARVVNVSSHNSQDAVKKCSPELRQRFNDPNLTMEGLESLMKEFVGLTKENKHEAAGWPSKPYSVSKIGVTVMSFIQQKELDAQEREDIIVNAVTGSNKGIGFAIVRALCKQFEGDVYLTARDVNRGENAVKQLNQEGLSPKFHQLDIDDYSSVERLRDFLQDTYGGLDVLVNNAGIAFKVNKISPSTTAGTSITTAATTTPSVSSGG